MKKVLGISVVIFVLFSFFLSSIITVSAQLDACDFLPCDQAGGVDIATGEVNDSIGTIFRFSASLVFVAFIGFGVFTIIKGAVTIIQGEGSEESLVKGSKTIKAVFIGVALVLIGIFGLLIVTELLGARGILNSGIEEPPGVDLPIL